VNTNTNTNTNPEELTNNDRAEFAHRAIDKYAQGRGYEAEEMPGAAIADLLTDLLHLADQYGLDFNAILSDATLSYHDETIGL